MTWAAVRRGNRQHLHPIWRSTLITLRKKVTRPDHLVSGLGVPVMWTAQSESGGRAVYMRCPHCDQHHRVTEGSLKIRFRWMREAARWLRAGRAKTP
jgi:hypothetical protein